MRVLCTIALLVLPFFAAAQFAEKPQARVVPNPATDVFVLQVSAPTSLTYTAELRDLTGNPVRRTAPHAASERAVTQRVDVRDLQRGIYFCRVAFSTGEVQTVRVLLE